MNTHWSSDRRLGETGLLPFRTRRVFNIGADWFFAVRGSKDCGPYGSEQDAQSGLTLYLGEVSS